MPPVVALALALMGGILCGTYLVVPTVVAVATLIVLLLAALGFATRPGFSSNDRRIQLVGLGLCAAFFALGIALGGISAAPASSRTYQASPQNPTYLALAKQAEQAFKPDDAALFLAIVFGDQHRVAFERREAFRRAGLLHIFAASGFNVTIAAGFIMLGARLIRAPKLVAGGLGLASIAGYYWLVGPSPSVTRATMMAGLLYLAIFGGRRVDPFASMGAAAMVMLMISPRALFDIGWQLSFASLVGILLIYPWIISLVEPKVVPIVAPFAITLSAQVGVSPILLTYFGQLSTVAVLVNPLVTAVVGLITGLGFFSSLLSLCWGAAGRSLMTILAPLLNIVRFTAEFFAALPSATVQFKPSLLTAAIFLGTAVGVGYFLRRHIKTITVPVLLALILVLQATGVWLDLASGIHRAGVSAEFLDVGQGDATLIRTRKGGVVLVDGGDNYRYLDRSLRLRGIKKIDILILSHPHADHLGALDELLNNYPVGRIMETGYAHSTQAYNRFKDAARTRGVEVIRVRAGQEYELGDLEIEIIWPGDVFLEDTGSDINNNSLVAMIRYGEFEVLLPGDIEVEAIEQLTSGAFDLRADVLKVSHQGAKNGTTDAWLRRVRPKHAVISVSADNSYGHPHLSTLRRLHRYVAEVARTDRDGDVYISADGQHINMR